MAAMLVDISNEADLRHAGDELSKSAHCLSYAYGAEAAFKKGREIQKLTVNTKPRYLAYMKYNDAMNGNVFFMPPKNICKYIRGAITTMNGRIHPAVRQSQHHAGTKGP